MWRCFVLVFALIPGLSLGLSVPSLEQVSRQEVVRSFCRNNINNKLDSSSRSFEKFDHILIEPKHNLLYCYVPKVACTNWKRILYVLSGYANTTNLAQIPASLVHENGTFLRLNQLKSAQINHILTNQNNRFINLIVVRHPFERLLSAFRNKFEGVLPSAKYFQKRIGRYIIKKYRPNATNASLESGSDVTFREFVQYVIKENLNETKVELINEHWRPINRICWPCTIDYTYIIKYEYLIEEAEMLLDLIRAENIDFPQTKVSKTNVQLMNYYRQLSLDEIRSLYEFYKMDFLMFEYSLEGIFGFDIS